MCARFAIAHRPGERLGRRKSAESGKTYPGAILLGPRIIAVDSPWAEAPDRIIRDAEHSVYARRVRSAEVVREPVVNSALVAVVLVESNVRG